jgi:hypothetical protein
MKAFEYKGYTIKFEYGGWGVNGSMFETKQAAKDFVSTLPMLAETSEDDSNIVEELKEDLNFISYSDTPAAQRFRDARNRRAVMLDNNEWDGRNKN